MNKKTYICDQCGLENNFSVSYNNGFYCGWCIVSALETAKAELEIEKKNYQVIQRQLDEQNEVMLKQSGQLVELLNKVDELTARKRKK